MKDKYILDAENRFTGKALELVKKQIELFYSEPKGIVKTKYKVGDKVFLKKGTFMHGIFGEIDNFDYTIDNGFISGNFTGDTRSNKICNSVGMWNIQEDMYLKDYINEYSGFTISYSVGRGPDAKVESILIPYHKFDEITEKINNDDNIWTYWGDKTKEVSFIPSLVSDKRQIAFILNMESDYAKELAKQDVWNTDIEYEILEPFLDYRYYPKFKDERVNKTKATTDRESSIMFGLPTSLIEGVFVGRKIENNKESLDHIKSRLPDCYICNLDGKVIVGNE